MCSIFVQILEIDENLNCLLGTNQTSFSKLQITVIPKLQTWIHTYIYSPINICQSTLTLVVQKYYYSILKITNQDIP